MVQNRREWDYTNGAGTNDANSWLNSLGATSDHERISRLQTVAPPDLSRCWPQLTFDERYFIQMSFASANGLLETVKILARLAECLRQQLAELQASPSGNDRG
jgi:hypothetical protein